MFSFLCLVCETSRTPISLNLPVSNLVSQTREATGSHVRSLLSLRHVTPPLSALPSHLVAGPPTTIRRRRSSSGSRQSRVAFSSKSHLRTGCSSTPVRRNHVASLHHRLTKARVLVDAAFEHPRQSRPYRGSVGSFIASPVGLSSRSVRVCRSDAIYAWQRPDCEACTATLARRSENRAVDRDPRPSTLPRPYRRSHGRRVFRRGIAQPL